MFVRRFLEESVRSGETLAEAMTPEAMERLLSYSWPGNVRQLRNEILRAAILTRGRGKIRPEDLSDEVGGRAGVEVEDSRASLRRQVDVAQRTILLRTLDQHGWNKTHSARALGVTRQGLIKMLHRLGIPLRAPQQE
ncbi:MAG: hypothetical protein HKN12_01190 [Gemmatimonadetes bacterium]|nr:hypothetical protein [Gemmatimonadota bacterium]